MNTYLILFLTLLWSYSAQANLNWNFVTVDKTKYSKISDLTQIQNLPKVQSQDSLGICFGMSASVVANHYHCKHKKLDCQKTSKKNLVSPLEMTSYANRNDDSAAGGTSGNHTNIRFGGSGAASLFYASKLAVAMADSCQNFDHLVNVYGDNQEMMEKTLAGLEEMYNKQKTESGGGCVECLTKTIKEKLGSDVTTKDVKIALKGDDFSEFLYFTTVGRRSCEDLVEFEPEPKAGLFPPNGTKEAKYEDMMTKIKEVLKSGYPLVLDELCPATQNGKCVGTHSVAVTGYRKQCTPSGQCREVLKIQNSWGEDWQKANDDGWLDAQTLFENKKTLKNLLGWWYN